MGNQVVQVKDAVEVVGFVLNGLGQHTIGLEAQFVAVQILVADAYPLRPVDHSAVAGQAETAFLNLALPFPPDNLRVDQRHRLLPALHPDYKQTQQHADLVGRQADAAMGRHSLRHIGGQLAQFAVKPRYLARPLAQYRVGEYPHFQHSHDDIRPPARATAPASANCEIRNGCHDYIPKAAAV